MKENYVICRKMDGIGDHVKQVKQSSGNQTSHFHLFVESRPKRMMMIIIIMGHECKRRTVSGVSMNGEGKDTEG
jgi:hypothetical protein